MTRITQHEIAARLGVSQNTVSAALRGSPRISIEVRQRILDCATDLGYRVHHAGRAMVTGRSATLALILSTDATRSGLPGGLLHGVLDGAAAHGQHLLVAKIADERLVGEEAIPRLMREINADGLLVNYNWRLPAQLNRLIVRHAIPAIYVNDWRRHDAVRPDEIAGVTAVVGHLVAAGRRRIAYADLYFSAAGVRRQHPSQRDRESGYHAGVEAAGMPAVVWRPPADAPAQDFPTIARDLIAAHPEVDAVIANGSDTAHAIIAEAHAARRRVPDDLALVLIDAQPAWGTCGGLPTLLVPNHGIGRQAVDLLIAKIARPRTALPTVIVPCRWYAGGHAPVIDCA